MSRGKKVALLELEGGQQQAALQVLKSFLKDRFELELGSFEVQEVLDLIGREIAKHPGRDPARRLDGGLPRMSFEAFAK